MMKKWFCFLFLMLFTMTAIRTVAQTKPEPVSIAKTIIDIGSERILFFDTSLIQSMSGAVLELQTPELADLSLDFRGNLWEGPWAGQGPTILKDGAVYRMYYFAPMTWRRNADTGTTAYAESRDGVHWIRPLLRQVVFNGSRENNLLSLPQNVHPFRIIRPFIDTRPGVPSSQKYKAVAGATEFTGPDSASYTDGLYILVSADGLHWNKYSDGPYVPAQRFSSPDGKKNYPNPVDYDGMNTMFWSDAEQKYVSFYRGWIRSLPLKDPDDSYGGTGWYRWVKKTTSPDLITWSKPVLMDTADLKPEQWYMHAMAPYFRSPSYYVGIPSHYITFLHPDFSDSIHDGHVSRCESRFTFSRAGTTGLGRYFASERFIRSGLPNDPGYFFPFLSGWPVFAGRMGLNVVPTADNEISCYLEQAGRIVRYKLRTDGFTAISARDTGMVVTKLVRFSGDKLFVNYSTSPGGNIRIELEDESGRPIKGFSLAGATPLYGDHISKQVLWGKKSNVGSLSGRSIRIKFVLREAKLYSFKFIPLSQQDH